MVSQVLVTGGTGFIGSWCVVALLNQGYSVRTTVRDRGAEPALRRAIARASPANAALEVHVADLTRDDGWPAAVAGCSHVLHVASPLGLSVRDPAALLDAARGGTLRVLRAALDAGASRVVMTSAAATARAPHAAKRVSDESIWADPDDPQFDAYRRSKILAERAAWTFMQEAGATDRFATMLPGAVFGPVLMRERLGSVSIIDGLLAGRPPRMPRMGFYIVDVRDLAEMHVRAMLAPAAAGERFLVASEFMWMSEVAATLRTRLGDAGLRVPRKTLPSTWVRALALFSPRLRTLRGDLDRRNEVSTDKVRRMLGFAPRGAADTLVDCANSLLALAAAAGAGS